jgi:hypothetical protein
VQKDSWYTFPLEAGELTIELLEGLGQLKNPTTLEIVPSIHRFLT